MKNICIKFTSQIFQVIYGVCFRLSFCESNWRVFMKNLTVVEKWKKMLMEFIIFILIAFELFFARMKTELLIDKDSHLYLFTQTFLRFSILHRYDGYLNWLFSSLFVSIFILNSVKSINLNFSRGIFTTFHRKNEQMLIIMIICIISSL